MNFECPSCNRKQIVGTENSHFESGWVHVGGKSKYGRDFFSLGFVRCLNEDCNELVTHFSHINDDVPRISVSSVTEQHVLRGGTIVSKRRLIPLASGKLFPDFIPKPIREDYEEACLIVSLSPKSSATLARRCIQGMIRDFCKISEKTLFLEIAKLKKLLTEDKLPKGVSDESIEAIEQIRQLGNIGAHMESDINVIVDIDSDEAELLVQLVEQLIDEWYLSRNAREVRLQKVKETAAQKRALVATLAITDDVS